jgi:RNA polymerase-binding transcription factor
MIATRRNCREKELIKVPQSPEMIRKFEEKLRNVQEQIESVMLAAVEQGREIGAPEETKDPVDRAVHAYQKEMLYSQGHSGAAQLMLVRQALERIREGTYGDCVRCEREIGLKRLEALPWTPFCIDCQERIERGEVVSPMRAA